MREDPRELTASEHRRKDEFLARFLCDVSSLLEPEYVWTMSPRDLSTVNWVFAEGLDSSLNPDLLELGSRLLLGEVLVQQQGFRWASGEDGGGGYAVVQPEVGFTVVLDKLRDEYSPGDDDPTEAEPFDLGDLICSAYERITLEVKRRKHGL